MMKRFVQLGIMIWILWMGLTLAGRVKAEEGDDPSKLSDTQKISGCISKYNGILEAISKANTNNQQDLKQMQAQVAGIKTQIKQMEAKITNLSADIMDREVKIGVKEQVLAAKVRSDYIRKREEQTLRILFSAARAADFFREMSYGEKLARQDRQIILD